MTGESTIPVTPAIAIGIRQDPRGRVAPMQAKNTAIQREDDGRSCICSSTSGMGIGRPVVFVAVGVVTTACLFELPEPRAVGLRDEEDGSLRRDGEVRILPDGRVEPVVIASDAGPDAAPAWCATIDATFCEDFGGAPFEDGRFEKRTTGGGQNKPVRDDVLSPPAALLATIPRIDAGRAWGYFRHTLPGDVQNGIRLEMAVRVDTVPADGQHIMIAPIGIGGVWFTALLMRPDRSLTLTERTAASTFVEHGAAGSLPLGTWTRIAIDVTIPPAGRIVVTVGGDVTRDVPFTSPNAAGAASIQFGISNAEPVGGPWALRFDDVRVDMR